MNQPLIVVTTPQQWDRVREVPAEELAAYLNGAPRPEGEAVVRIIDPNSLANRLADIVEKGQAPASEKEKRKVVKTSSPDPVQQAVVHSLLKEAKKDFRIWRQLAIVATVLLVALLIFTAYLLRYLFLHMQTLKYNGPSIALIIFTMAVFVISPAVLLLIGRPLAGIDNYTPGGSVKKEEPAAAEKDKEDADAKDEADPAKGAKDDK